jgi:hypothetical protein
VLQVSSGNAQSVVKPHSPKLYVSRRDTAGAARGEDTASSMPTDDKENSVFYLKLQWISAKDDAERARVGERIRRFLAKQAKPT